MEPIVLLMEEHKVILKVIETLKVYKKNLEKRKDRAQILEKTIDFFRIYADKSHHGKEESILFDKVKKKPLKEEEKAVLLELIKEHEQGRKLVSKLDSLKGSENFSEIEKVINDLVELYEKHIEKENLRFFKPAFSYFSLEEKKKIFDEFMLVDRKAFNENYFNIVSDIEKNLKNAS